MLPIKFFPKPAKFESKSQVAPNSIIFHRNLSSDSKIFLLALNGIATCTQSWTPIQSDLQKRLGFGRDKIRNVIKQCIAYGFLTKRQLKDSGRFGFNEFEYDLEGGYLKIENETPLEECPHSNVSPMTCYTATEIPTSEKPALPYTRHKPCSKKEVYDVIDRNVHKSANHSMNESKSMTLSTQECKSMEPTSRFKLTEAQRETYEFLKSLDLHETLDTQLTWWAKTYSITRLAEVHQESCNRGAANIGAYMQNLLSKNTIVCSGRIEINRQFAKEIKLNGNLNNLTINKKYGIIETGSGNIEIDFNMDTEDFAILLMEKVASQQRRH